MQIAIHWFRRDLRWEDNVGLYHALTGDLPVLPLFIFDTNILDQLEDKVDKRVDFIHQQLKALQKELVEKGSSLCIKYGKPLDVWQQLIEAYEIGAVYTNRDYEPYAQERDKAIYQLLNNKGIPFKGYKNHVIFEKSEVVKKDGKPYTVFTPYSRTWRKCLATQPIKTYPNALALDNFYQTTPLPFPSLEEIGFLPTHTDFPPKILNENLLPEYKEKRDYPAQNNTTKLSVHLRFGTVSIRQLVQKAQGLSDSWLNELIWRDFYQAILYHFPHAVDRAFKPAYDFIPWRNKEQEFEAWCAGKTGYPLVDAGMRELNETGFMHNRVRMVVASFLTKHLLIDWRWGEAYFAQKLLDFELASNNGGWQWAASSGCDAAPYFRVFNPTTQFKKFDKHAVYVKRWVPEYGTFDYPKPIVEHKIARQRAIDTYKEALSKYKQRSML